MLHDIAAVDLDTMPPKYMAACVEAGLSPDAGACCTGRTQHLLQSCLCCKQLGMARTCATHDMNAASVAGMF
jgi:hypothetical protein